MSRSPQPTSADMESASSHNGNAHSSGNDAHATDSSPILTASDGLTASQLSDIAHEYGITSNELASYLQTLPKEYNGIYHMLPYDFCDLPEDRISIPPGPDDLRRIAAMLAATEEIHESPTAHHETYAMADEDNFGGLSYDSGKGRFVEGHVIETTGEMDDLGQEDWKDITDDMELDRSGTERRIGRVGLAAAKMVKGDFTCSGVLYEKKYFLTTVHWDEGFIDEDQDVWINTNREAQSDDHKMYQATLLEADRNMDIAVFRLADHETRQFVHYITRAMLGYTDNATDLKGKPVWSVGYAVDGSQGPRFKTYVDGLIAGFAQSEDLKKRDIATEMRGQLPDFRSIFHPKERTLTLGRLEDLSDDERWLHSCPGWFGVSGSMIGILLLDKICILGLFQGGDPNAELNRMIPFTTSRLELIDRNVQEL